MHMTVCLSVIEAFYYPGIYRRELEGMKLRRGALRLLPFLLFSAVKPAFKATMQSVIKFSISCLCILLEI